MNLKIFLCLLVGCTSLTSMFCTDTDDIGKQTILADQFAQFKKESGFRGVYRSDASQTRIQEIVGNFKDTIFSADLDDIQLGLISEDILTRIKPIIQVQGDLVLAKVERHPGLLRASYQQIINGYKVKQDVYVTIEYYSGRKYFDLYNDTWGIDTTPVDTVIAREEAIAIWRDRQQKYDAENLDEAEPQTDLAYYLLDMGTNMGIQLSWMISGANNACLINAVNGKVRMYYGFRLRNNPNFHLKWGLLDEWAGW